MDNSHTGFGEKEFIDEQYEQENDELEKDQLRYPLGIRKMLNTFKNPQRVVDKPASVENTLTLSSTENTTTGANTFSWVIQEEEEYEEREPKPPSSLSNLVADGSRYVDYINMLMVKERVDIIELLYALITSIENSTTDNIVT